MSSIRHRDNSGIVYRDLGQFSPMGYDKGRNIFWQISWHIVSHLLFQPFYCPRFVRPTILRLFGAKVGSRAVIKSRVRIHWPWKLRLGSDVWLGEGVWILNLENVITGNSVCISQEVMICTGSHDSKSKTFQFKNRPIVVEDQVWICARAIILAGSSIAKGTVVPAGMVVRRTDRNHSK